jgi:class 3 adenylate cyclase
MIRTVLELDLAGYSDIAIALEEALDVQAVRKFEDQIQTFVDHGLEAVALSRDLVVLGTAGDNAILIFESAAQMHQFAASVQQACFDYNLDKTTPLARRWFRMGAATGEIEFDEEKRRIIGTTIARAVRLEAASERGTILVDRATFEALPGEIKAVFGPPRIIRAKRRERILAHQARFIPASSIDDGPDQHPLPSRRLALVGVAAAVAASIGLGYRSLFPKKPPERPLDALRGSADIRVFNPDVPKRNDRSIAYRDLLPLRPGDRVRLEVRLSRPAFLYLVWIAPSGEVIPVYPWRGGRWDTPENPEPVSQLNYPSKDSTGVPMKPNVEGREVFLALARPTPLPKDHDLKATLARCMTKLPVRNPRAMVRFRNHDVEATAGEERDPDFFLADETEDEFYNVAARLKQEIGSAFEFVDGLAFASQIASK